MSGFPRRRRLSLSASAAPKRRRFSAPGRRVARRVFKRGTLRRVASRRRAFSRGRSRRRRGVFGRVGRKRFGRRGITGKRIVKRMKKKAKNAFPSPGLTVNYGLAGSVFSPGTEGFLAATDLYGNHSDTGFNRWGMRTIADVNDPRIIYLAAEKAGPLSDIPATGLDGTKMLVRKVKTTSVCTNRTSFPVHCELFKLMNRDDRPYTSGTATNSVQINAASASTDFYYPQWDHVLGAWIAGAVETQSPLGTSYPAATAFSPLLRWWELPDFTAAYKVKSVIKFVLGPGKRRTFSATRMVEQDLSMAQYYNTTIGSAYRRVDQRRGDEVWFLRVRGREVVQNNDDTSDPNPSGMAFGWAPAEVIFHTKQTAMVNMWLENPDVVYDAYPTSGFIEGYTRGKGLFSASSLNADGSNFVDGGTSFMSRVQKWGTNSTIGNMA
nr:MAG: capsid protein [Cressdnaviricota sp.]